MGYLNPLMRLPAGRALLALSERERVALRSLLLDLRGQANAEAETAWVRRKGPMVCYWRAVATYARHIAHLLKGGDVPPAAERDEVQRLLVELDTARRQVEDFIAAARSAVPQAEHPKHESPHNWALQVRLLGQDRRAAYEQLEQVRQGLGRAARTVVA
jgi:hypothetical protein